MTKPRSNKKTELRAIDLMRKYYSQKKFIVGNVSQKHIGMDLILIPYSNLKKVYSIEVKGMKQDEPQALRLYESFMKFAKYDNYFLDIVCGVNGKSPHVYHIESKFVLNWAEISKQSKCYHILDIRTKLREAKIRPRPILLKKAS